MAVAREADDTVDASVVADAEGAVTISSESEENIRRQRKIRVCAPHEGPDLVNIAVGGSGGTLIRNKFRKGSCFQVVYDWAGSMPIMPLYFSLHRAGGEIIRHTDRLQGHETLNSAQRDPQESFQFLGDEVTFFGNFHIDSHAEDTLREETVETLDCSKPKQGEQKQGEQTKRKRGSESQKRKNEKKKAKEFRIKQNSILLCLLLLIHTYHIPIKSGHYANIPHEA
ncbi:uncharacterized protein LOC5521085 isoform X2 [Nematostella vectensis]|uniref:uncharacterized protein LOC5521085 isoform X2 n=1 Tax=Nematostella vectensis TaxID=45351 RepID=UPI002076D9EA|nr:uncharacterized protein LOC5521085 isoform X2 [Nematostella vectensis]